MRKKMHRQKEKVKKQLNNKGFSLLEVLVAIIILSIVSIPIIRSFATVAKTNANAKVLLRATDAAENMMENLEYQTLEELAVRYAISDQNVIEMKSKDGSDSFVIGDPTNLLSKFPKDYYMTITIKDPADIPVKLPAGYHMTISVDPTLYPNANALNIADVKSMSTADTAVYEMSQLYDAGVYEKFDTWNMEAHDDQPLLYQRINKDYFKENLTRTIEIVIDKKGTDTDENGNEVDLVTVNLNIRYYFKSKSMYQKYLPVSQKEYVESTRELYNNLTTKIPLSSIFIFYQPRYLATVKGNSDNILINNPDNVQVNVMLAAQRGAADASYKTQYFNAVTGPNVTVVENPEGNIADADGAVTLLTNLSSGAPYSSLPNAEGTLTDGEVLCNLIYQNPAGTAKAKGKNALKILDGRDLDGKALTAANTKNRIYKVKVTVWDNNVNNFVELDGTKLE